MDKYHCDYPSCNSVIGISPWVPSLGGLRLAQSLTLHPATWNTRGWPRLVFIVWLKKWHIPIAASIFSFLNEDTTFPENLAQHCYNSWLLTQLFAGQLSILFYWIPLCPTATLSAVKGMMSLHFGCRADVHLNMVKVKYVRRNERQKIHPTCTKCFLCTGFV